MPEETIWSGSPSQIKNIKPITVCVLVVIAIFTVAHLLKQTNWPWALSINNYILLTSLIPIGIGVWKWLQVNATKFQLTTERLLITRGVINVATDSLELYRVKDIRMTQPFLLRFLGLENIDLTTSDLSTQFVCVEQVPKSVKLGDLIRTQVEACRLAKGSREMEIQ